MSTVTIAAGANIQAAIDANPTGTVFQFAAGVYQGQQFEAKSGDQFLGDPSGGTILDGATVLNQWTQSGSYWVAGGLPSQLVDGGYTGSNPLANYDNDLFIDNVLYQRVSSLAQVTTGTWYFDTTTNSVYISENPAGHAVEYSELPYLTTDNGTTNVVVENLTVEKYAAAAQIGAINDLQNATFVNVTAEWNHGDGLSLGSGDIVQGGRYNHNGQLGIHGGGSNNVQVAGAEIAYNNYAGYNTGWEAGGIKVSAATGVLISGNNVHDNNGQGIWNDVNDFNVVDSNNTVTNNNGVGILYEVSHGTSSITGNTVSNNADSGIYISNSDGVTVSGNTVTVRSGNTTGGDGDGGGIDVVNNARGSGPYGVYQSINDTVQNNVIIHPNDTARDGIIPIQALPAQPNDIFDDNTYYVSDANGQYWQFGSANLTWTMVHQDTSFETNGVLKVGLPPPSFTPSPNGTTIIKPTDGPIIDASGNAWSLLQSASQGLQIAVNGTVDPVTADVVLLQNVNGAMVQENSFGNWYSEMVPTSSWIQIPNPNPSGVTTGSGSDTLVIGISGDAYANGDGTSDANGDAAFTVSVDGKQLAGTFYATASHSTGLIQNFTFKGDWAPGTHTVAVAFLNDAYAGTPSTDRNLYVNDVTYDGTDTKQSAALMSSGSQSFSVTDSTAIQPVVTGGGSDSLLIMVSEDYYLANAQFTVSVDGKQLGGTFTATTLHSSGNSQTFAFAGDFGSGQHTVSVNFLNDAWAGTAATDRNLYVNDIVYNGIDTGQTAALKHQGAKTFAISGGTTPSVSETGDHGSLQKNLSQTGTYTVGGDTFVLGSGNAATVTLGAGTSQIKFVGPSSVTLTGGSGQATVTADAGSNKFVAGAGSLDVTGGPGKDAYVFHSTSGLLTLEDFSLAKGDTLTIDKSLQGSLHEASDGIGGVMLTFGTAGHGVDIHGLAALPSSNIVWA
jgi:parallel beta-helix repeat protein